MRNPENVLISLTKHSNQKDYKYERIYRLLYNEELYLTAYQNIYSNDGSMTKGTDKQTVDGMSIERIRKIIVSLKDESYQPKPARRTYIPINVAWLMLSKKPLMSPSINHFTPVKVF